MVKVRGGSRCEIVIQEGQWGHLSRLWKSNRIHGHQWYPLEASDQESNGQPVGVVMRTFWLRSAVKVQGGKAGRELDLTEVGISPGKYEGRRERQGR